MGDSGVKKEKEMDPEEQMRRKFRAKCLFRALGRMVMANAYWLIEATDHYEGLENVKRRVEQAVRSKGRKKQLLGINDKTLLNKSAKERTDQEKKYLYRILGGLKCFKRYPNHVKKKLAAATYFKYYGPGRTIVRQHQEAHALYFIVTGDVVVSQMVFDELLQQHLSVNVGTLHPGDMFGEVSLLHNIPRTATVTTAGHCELLVLMKEDFKNVLQASIQKQWDEVRDAMSAFTYFDALDEVARREGCIVAKMKNYRRNETLLGDGVGVPNFVYFILSGQCQMIESMQVILTTRQGRTYYSLYDPYMPQEESEQDLEAKYFGARKTAEKESVTQIKVSSVDNTSGQVKPTLPKAVRGSLKDTGSAGKLSSGQVKSEASKMVRDSSKDLANEGKLTSTLKQDRRSISIKSESTQFKTDAAEYLDEESANRRSKDLLKPGQREQLRSSIRLSFNQEVVRPAPPKNLHTYFMQVCQLNPGSSFGFGENMRDRRIVALNSVSCMLLPKIWLLQRNTANIWTRIQHYLEKKIPTKKQLFKDFVSARRWSEFRDQLVNDVVSRTNTVNWTSVHDVPYSIRMEEMLDV